MLKHLCSALMAGGGLGRLIVSTEGPHPEHWPRDRRAHQSLHQPLGSSCFTQSSMLSDNFFWLGLFKIVQVYCFSLVLPRGYDRSLPCLFSWYVSRRDAWLWDTPLWQPQKGCLAQCEHGTVSHTYNQCEHGTMLHTYNQCEHGSVSHTYNQCEHGTV